ncbi:nitrate reductase molybdenum cofactor assembly chaperone [Pseudaquidulcibacter saccharophilus]|uniref:nitrate reductase molybdenum cofactor assembly chaperone n=1 Tax=Pseudaquidulcibacter saccharophilus TaxID=2831900 RepID=UPI001EFF2911|nr:nitrate reductase molybdenum cofactor assembly chaperone [Pseudaquidulcibacter saccharophilus]
MENNLNLKTRNSFKALGILLWYPNNEWLECSDELLALMKSENCIEDKDFNAIKDFINSMKSGDLFTFQENYVDTFDRVRTMSLHLFEHVHGDSRERGQAMIDLSDRYLEQGLKLDSSELPDYLPMFLEYLATLPVETALEELDEVAHILKAIGTKLKERGNQYFCIFQALLKMVGQEIGDVVVKADEETSFDELDKEWEEKQIEFLGAQNPDNGVDTNSCGTCPSSVKSNCSLQTNIPQGVTQ